MGTTVAVAMAIGAATPAGAGLSGTTAFAFGDAARRTDLTAGAGGATGGAGFSTAGARATRGLGGARSAIGATDKSRSGGVSELRFRAGAFGRATGALVPVSGSGIAGDSVRCEAGRRGKGDVARYVNVLL